MTGSEATGRERWADLLVRDAELVTMTGDEIRGG